MVALNKEDGSNNLKYQMEKWEYLEPQSLDCIPLSLPFRCQWSPPINTKLSLDMSNSSLLCCLYAWKWIFRYLLPCDTVTDRAPHVTNLLLLLLLDDIEKPNPTPLIINPTAQIFFSFLASSCDLWPRL